MTTPMKILIISKRQYTGRDLLDDQYGRLFEIPAELTNQGHHAKGLTVSYKQKNEGDFEFEKLKWRSINALPFIQNIKFFYAIKKILQEFKPDIVWVSSDAWCIICTEMACTHYKTPFIVDFYDNYESFNLTKFPFFRKLLYRSCRKSIGITVVSKTLKNHLVRNKKILNIPIEIIGNGINPNIFFPMEKAHCRSSLKLPLDGILIGTAGSLDSSRGIKILLDVFEVLSKRI